jgi:hypothetical protein
MFSQDDNDPEATARELAERASDLVEALEHVGVYVQTHQVVVQGTPHGPVPGLFVTGILGRVAFGDRVQRPDQEVVDTLFQDMTDNLIETEYEERRRALDE